MVFAAHGLNGTAAITAMTVQSTRGVAGIHTTDPELLTTTLEDLEADLPPAGIKIGMLGSASVVRTVCDHLDRLRSNIAPRKPPIVVVDPVLQSSSGRDLIDPEGTEVVRDRLLPMADWVTPNVAEIGLFVGMPVASREELELAGRLLSSRYPGLGVLAKGGHIEPPDDLLILPDGRSEWVSGRRVKTRATHGTGCALSSAFLAQLVLGAGPTDAARRAKAYVRGALLHSYETGSGPCKMNHLWPLHKPLDPETTG